MQPRSSKPPWAIALIACALAVGCNASSGSGGTGTPQASASASGEAQRVAVRASAAGFEPAEVHFAQHGRAILVLTRTDDSDCVSSVRMPWRTEAYDLPKDQPVEIEIPDTSKAGTFTYACWMSMLFGRVTIDPH